MECDLLVATATRLQIRYRYMYILYFLKHDDTASNLWNVRSFIFINTTVSVKVADIKKAGD